MSVLTKKPYIGKKRMFSIPQNTTTDKGIVSLDEIKPRQKVAALDVVTGKKIFNRMQRIEKIKMRGRFFIINNKALVFENQSLMIGPHAIHAKKLKLGMELTLEDGTKQPITDLREIKAVRTFYRTKVSGNHCYFLNGILMHNASRFWILGTANWDAATTTNWAATSGGGGGSSVPTSVDDVTFDGASNATGYTCTVTATANCRDLIVGNPASGVITFAGSAAINVYGSFSGPSGGNWTHTGTITFSSTTTGKTVTLNGITLGGNVAYNGVGGAWTLQDTYAQATTRQLSVVNGSFLGNAQTINVFQFVSQNNNVRTINITNCAVNLSQTSGNAWVVDNGSGGAAGANLTLTTTGSTITMTGSTSGTTNTVSLGGGNKTYNNVVFNGPMRTSVSFSNTIANLTIIGSNDMENRFIPTLDQTITGALTVTGFSRSRRILFMGAGTGFEGTKRTLTCGSVSLSNVDFQDIGIAGAANPASGTSIGDCLGCTGITFQTPRTLYWINNAGSTSDSSHWSLSSGGTGGEDPPLPQDTVVFDANSFTISSQTLVADMPRFGKNVSFATIAIAISMTMRTSNIQGTSFYGNVALNSLMTVTGGDNVDLAGRSTYTVDTAGITLPNSWTVRAPGGTYTQQSAFISAGATGLTLALGTLDVNGFNNQTRTFVCGTHSVGSQALKLGSGTWSLTDTGTTTIWNITSPDVVITKGTSTLKFTGTSANTRTFAGGTNNAYATIWFSGTGTSQNNITGNITVDVLKDDNNTNAHTVQLAAGVTITLTSGSGFQINGVSGKLISLISSSAGTPATISCASGVISADYLSIKDSTVSGGALAYPGTHSTNVSGNTGWLFGNTFQTATFTESLSVSETFSKQAVRAFAETIISVTENFTKLTTRSFNDYAIANDGNMIKNSDMRLQPPFTAAQTSNDTWIDGTSAGSATLDKYGWYYAAASLNFGGTTAIQYTNYQGRDCIQVQTTKIGQSGGGGNAIVAVSIAQYPGPTVASNVPGYMFPAAPGQVYTLSWDHFVTQVDSHVAIRGLVTFYDSTRTRINNQSSAAAGVDSAWTTTTTNFTAPAGTVWVHVMVGFFTNGSAFSGEGGNFYLTNVSLRPQISGSGALFSKLTSRSLLETFSLADTLVRRGLKSLVETVSLSETLVKLTSRSFTDAQHVIDGNIVDNGDFNYAPPFTAAQTSSGRWLDGTAAGTLTRTPYKIHGSFGGAAGDKYVQFENSPAKSYNGTPYLKIHINSGAYCEVRANATGYFQADGFRLQPNTTYQYSVRAMSENVAGSSAGQTVVLLFSDSSGTAANLTSPPAVTQISIIGSIAINKAWTTYTGSFTTGPTVAWFHPEFRVYGHTGAATLSGEFYFEDFFLQQINSGSVILMFWKSALKMLSDSVTISDWINQSLSKLLTDTITVTDSLLIRFVSLLKKGRALLTTRGDKSKMSVATRQDKTVLKSKQDKTNL